MGLSGNKRIHIFPPRRAWRVIARRPASICLDVIQAGSRALRANLPKQTRLPRADIPPILPRCCLRNLVLTGLSMASYTARCCFANVLRLCVSIDNRTRTIAFGVADTFRRVGTIQSQELLVVTYYIAHGGSVGWRISRMGAQPFGPSLSTQTFIPSTP